MAFTRMRYDAGDLMQDKQIVDIFESTGLKVDLDTGVVSDGIFAYGSLYGSFLNTPPGDKLDLEDLVYLEFDPDTRRLIVNLADQGDVEVAGGPPVDSVLARAVPGQDDPNGEIFVADMPYTTLDLDMEFDRLFPDSREQLYYDELKERDMIDMAMLGCPQEGVVPINDRIVKLYHKVLQRRLRECGYIGKRFPSNLVMDEVLDIEIGNNRRNPFREWVEKQKWDGKPRLRRVMMDYFGATAPALRVKDDEMSQDEIQYLETVTEAWFLGAVARMYGPIQHDIVPVLIGIQGGGKGTGLRFLAGQDEWYAATTADVSNPERFLETVRGAIIVEMGEAKQIRGRNVQEDLKAFISQREDRIRKKYARYEETYPRHFILAATANNDSIFSDPTGARRFYPMYCRQANATKEIAVRYRGPALQYEVEQIWAEALHIFRNGGKCYVGKAVDELARIMQKEASIENPLSEMIEDWVDDPMNGYHHVGARIYRELIMEQVFGVDARCAPPNMDRAWADWIDSNRRWEKCKPFSHKGKTRRGFIRVKEPGIKIEVETLKLVDGDEPEWDDLSMFDEEKKESPSEPESVPEPDTGEKPRNIYDIWEGRWKTLSEKDKRDLSIRMFTNRINEARLKLDSAFPTFDISPNVIDWLVDNGYLYNMGTDKKPVYRIGEMPW